MTSGKSKWFMKKWIWALMVAIIVVVILVIVFVPKNNVENTEEDRAKEQAETSQEPEPTCEEKAVSGDFSCFAGKYISNNTGDRETVFDFEGRFPNGIGLAIIGEDSAGRFENDGKPIEIKQGGDGALNLIYNYHRTDKAWLGAETTQYEYILIPAGVPYQMHGFDMMQGKSVMKDTDASRDRIIDTVCDGCYELPIYYKEN